MNTVIKGCLLRSLNNSNLELAQMSIDFPGFASYIYCANEYMKDHIFDLLRKI